MIPITRKELYLNKIVGNNDYETPEKPITIEEFFFAEILGEAVQAPEPLTRYQMYLAKIAGREIEIPYPETRLEYFLAKAAGMDISTPVPITKEEIYWSNYTAIVEFEFEGVPPLTYKAIEGTLKNYRIYGNTVVGESVGDLITSGEHAGEYKVPVTVEGKNLLQNTSGSSTIFGVTYTVNDDGSITCNTDENGATRDSFYYPMGITLPSFAGKTIILSGGTTNIYVRAYHYQGNNTISSNGNDTKPFTMEQGFIDIYVPIGTVLNNITIFPMARLATIEDDTYEPYHAPVTTPIYLPEQIKKVGDEEEYIDYGEQKFHRISGADLDVTLPALPTIKGTNVLSVGTAVQPSKVYIKGEKER